MEEPLIGTGEPPVILEREEDVVDGHGGHIIRRLTPFAARTVNHFEVRSLAEQHIPGMKVAVLLAEAVGALFQPPAPGDGLLLYVLKGEIAGDLEIGGIGITQPH